MEQKEQIPMDILDSIHWLKICFRLRQELRFLEEDKKNDLYVFILALILEEEAKVWKSLEEELSI